MKIVAHNGATIWGGAERATTRLLAGLKSRGHEVLMLCNSPLVARKAQDEGVPSYELVIAGDVLIHHALRLKNCLEEINPDAFIIGTYKKLFLAGLGARMARVPKIVARVGLESDIPRSWKYRVALRRWIDGVVVNSTTTAQSYFDSGVSREQVKIIHNGIKPLVRVNDRDAARKKLPVPDGSFVIGTAARLAIQKRIDRLVEAVALLPDNVHCVIAGEGTRRGEIESVIRQKNLARRFHLIGHREDVTDFLSALDVYVVSSDTEGLSNSMLEAMSLGVPVVSTAVSGARDALVAGNDSQPGGLVVEREPRAIADAVRRLLDDAKLRNQIGEAARERISRGFSRDRMIEEWEKFLSSPA